MDIFRIAIGVLLVVTLASCSSTMNEPRALRPEITGGLVAPLRGAGTAFSGTAYVFDYRDGVQVQLSAQNLIPGQYRIAIHENGNCSSPNLFSAGPAWAPPGWTVPAVDLLPGFLVGNSGNQNGYVAYVPGLHADRPPSLRGRSVVIHWGSVVGEAFPGQPNNRIACGVLSWTDSIL